MMAFLEKLRTRVITERKGTTIDFSDTKSFIANATLLFYSELRRCIELTGGGVALSCRPPTNEKCAQVLKQIGVFDLLGCRINVVPTYDDVIHWRSASGRRVEGEKYEDILGTYDGRVAEPLLDSLFRGLSEAMTNCHHHAYILPRNDESEEPDANKNWWMFSQERDGFLSVVFCDLGAGIPRTLPLKKPALWQRLLLRGPEVSDSDAIDLAIESSISRTGKRYRGKGLKQLLEAVQVSPENSLYVFSNYGCYTFADGKKELRRFSTSIQGTLVQWRIKIPQ